MMCTAMNGYAGWKVIDKITGLMIERVLWVDPELKVYCTHDDPPRVVGNEVASTNHYCSEISVELSSTTFWIVKAPVQVAPLSPGRQADQEPSDKPCADCRQEGTCRRLGWCAAHRCGFGERAP